MIYLRRIALIQNMSLQFPNLEFLKNSRSLVLTEDSEGLDYFVKKECKLTSTPYLYVSLRNTQDLNKLVRAIKFSKGELIVSDGPLIKLIQQGGVLLINYQDSNPKMMESINDLFGDNQLFEGSTVSKNLKVIGMLNNDKNKWSGVTSALIGRYRHYSAEYSRPESSLMAVTEATDVDYTELFGSPNWEPELIGTIKMMNGTPSIIEGPLIKAIKANKPLRISGALWDDPYFRQFIHNLEDRKSIDFYGSTYQLGDQFYIEKLIEPNYNLGVSNKTITSINADPVPENYVINDENLDLLFGSVSIENKKMSFLPGLLDKNQLNLRIAGNIPLWAWHRIMHSPHQISLEISDDTSIPDCYRSYCIEKIEPYQKVECNLETALLQKIAVIHHNDPEIALALLRENVISSEVLFINNETSFGNIFSQTEVTGKIKGSYEFECHIKDIYTAIKNGKTVVISDLSRNPKLAEAMASVFMPNPYVMMNGVRVDLNTLSGRLVVIDSKNTVPLWMPIVNLNNDNYEQQIYSILKKEYPNFNSADWHKLLHLKTACESLPLPKNKEYQEDTGFSLSRVRNVLKQLDFSQQKISAKSWYRAIYNVFMDDYYEQPDILSFLSVKVKNEFGFSFLPDHSIDQVKLEKLKNLPGTLDDYYWQAIDTLSFDLLQQLDIPVRFTATGSMSNHEGLDLIKNAKSPVLYYRKEKDFEQFQYEWQHSFSRAAKILTEFPALFLKGPPGVGKTYNCTKIAETLGYKTIGQDKEVFGPITTGSDVSSKDIIGFMLFNEQKEKSEFSVQEILRFAKAPRGILFVDESNLPKDGFWDFMRGLFEEHPYLYVDGKKILLSNQHKVIFTGNQDRLPNRNVHKIVREHFLTVFFPSFEIGFLEQLVSEKYLHKKKLAGDMSALAKTIVELHQLGLKLTNPEEYSLRDIQEMCRRLPVEWDGNINDMMNSFHSVYVGRLSSEHQEALDKLVFIKYGINFPALREEKLKSTQNVIEKLKQNTQAHQLVFNKSSQEMMLATLEFLDHQDRDISAGKTSDGKNAVIWEGPSGRGKDALLVFTLRAKGYIEYSEFLQLDQKKQVEYQSNKKVYFARNASPNYDSLFKDVDLAVKFGFKMIISEANLLPTSILEGKLNDKLTDPALGFGLFMTINSLDYKGRERLSSALLNRTIYHVLPDYSQKEFENIVMEQKLNHVSDKDKKAVVQFHCWLRSQLKQKNSSIIPTTRQILECLKLIERGTSLNQALHQIYGIIYLKDVGDMRVESIDYRGFIEQESIDNIKVFQLLAKVIVPEKMVQTKDGRKVQPVRFYSFDPNKKNKQNAGADGLYSESDNTIGFNKLNYDNPDRMFEILFHEAGHGRFTRHSGTSIAKSLSNFMEDLRMLNAMSLDFPYLAGAGYDLSMLNYCKHINELNIQAIIDAEPKDVFNNVLGLYGLRLLERNQIQAVLSSLLEKYEHGFFGKHKLIPYIETFSLLLGNDNLEAARSAIQSVPQYLENGPNYLEEEVRVANSVANIYVKKIEEDFYKVPRDLSLLQQSRNIKQIVNEAQSKIVSHKVSSVKTGIQAESSNLQALESANEAHTSQARTELAVESRKNQEELIVEKLASILKDTQQNAEMKSTNKFKNIIFKGLSVPLYLLVPLVMLMNWLKLAKLFSNISWLTSLSRGLNHIPLLNWLTIEIPAGSSDSASQQIGSHDDDVETLFKAARRRKEYSQYSDEELYNICERAVFGKAGRPDDRENEEALSTYGNVVGEITKISPIIDSFLYYAPVNIGHGIKLRLNKTFQLWADARLRNSRFQFDREYSDNGVPDVTQLPHDPVNWFLKSGGMEISTATPIILNEKAISGFWIELNTHNKVLFDLLFERGYTVSLYTGENNLMENITDTRTLVASLRRGNNCDDKVVNQHIQQRQQQGEELFYTSLAELQKMIQVPFMEAAILDAAAAQQQPEIETNKNRLNKYNDAEINVLPKSSKMSIATQQFFNTIIYDLIDKELVFDELIAQLN